MNEGEFAIRPCKRCNVWDEPERLYGMLIHPDGRNEPHTEGPYCGDCAQKRKTEMDDPTAVREVARLQRLS